MILLTTPNFYMNSFHPPIFTSRSSAFYDAIFNIQHFASLLLNPFMYFMHHKDAAISVSILHHGNVLHKIKFSKKKRAHKYLTWPLFRWGGGTIYVKLNNKYAGTEQRVIFLLMFYFWVHIILQVIQKTAIKMSGTALLNLDKKKNCHMNAG